MQFESYRWKHRLFLIFAPDPEDDAYRCQRSLLRGSEGGFGERDLLRGDFFEEEEGAFAGEAVTPFDAGETRRRFVAVLVGKDGTAKRRSSEPVSPEELYAQIDAMPMRRREMRER